MSNKQSKILQYQTITISDNFRR